MLEGVVIDDTGLFNTRLKEWEDFYNFHRPHGSLGARRCMRSSVRRRGPGVNGLRQLYILSVPPGRTGRKGRKLGAFVQVEATYGLGA